MSVWFSIFHLTSAITSNENSEPVCWNLRLTGTML